MSSAASFQRLQDRENPWETAVNELSSRLVRPCLDCFPDDIVGSIPQYAVKQAAARVLEYLGRMGYLDVWEIIATEGKGQL